MRFVKGKHLHAETSPRAAAASELRAKANKNLPVGRFRSPSNPAAEINLCLVVADVMAALGTVTNTLEIREEGS